MNGNQMYEQKYIDKINKIINKNTNKTYLKGYYFYLLSNDLSYTTIYDYIRYVLNFMDYNKQNINDLRLDHYTEFLMEMKKYTSNYQIGVFAALKWFSKYLQLNKIADECYMDFLSNPKVKDSVKSREKREAGVLNKKEINQYINITNSGSGSKRAISRQKNWKERDLLIIMTFLNTGMRCSALYKLDVDSINLENRTITTLDKGNKTHEYYLSDEMIILIKQWLDKRNKILNNKNENALFISNQKTRMDNSSIYRIVNKYAKDIKHISPHKLRATFGTQLLKETGDLYLTQQSMGHSNPKTTEIYIRGLKDENKKTAASVMSKICFSND